jgi:hypothetical protein
MRCPYSMRPDGHHLWYRPVPGSTWKMCSYCYRLRSRKRVDWSVTLIGVIVIAVIIFYGFV